MLELTTLNVYFAADNGLRYCRRTGLSRTRGFAFGLDY
jgi:hypothetical protein